MESQFTFPFKAKADREDTNYSRLDQLVRAKYLDSALIEGKVIASRVKYGGSAQHSVELTSDVIFPWNGEVRQQGSVLLVEEDQIMIAINPDE